MLPMRERQRFSRCKIVTRILKSALSHAEFVSICQKGEMELRFLRQFALQQISSTLCPTIGLSKHTVNLQRERQYNVQLRLNARVAALFAQPNRAIDRTESHWFTPSLDYKTAQ